LTIIDAHLDLAFNALRGRDVLKPAAQQKPDPDDIPTCGLPDLHAGSVKVICATIFAEPNSPKFKGYTNAEEAHTAGWAQLQWYLDREKEGYFKIVRSKKDLANVFAKPTAPPWEPTAERRALDSAPLPAIILLEGADPLRSPQDVAPWFAAGMRLVGLAWRQTRLAGGTGNPGPLTTEGVALVKELDRFGIIHDTSHLAEESFWQLLHLTRGPVIASHSNCRSIVPTDRQLSDDMIRALLQRNGVIGINFYDRFLLPPGETRRATLADVVTHMKHICDLAGNTRQVAIGTDMDGGLGRDQIPVEITTSADLPKLADALTAAGFTDTDITNIMYDNWRRYFADHLADVQS
jgi:membrane dipeptidase